MSGPITWSVRTAQGDFRAGSIAELVDWLRLGRVKTSDYVWHPVLSRWMYVGELQELVGVDLTPPPVWVVPIGGVDHRPRDTKELVEWWRQGRIPENATLYHSDQRKWMPASETPELRSEVWWSDQSATLSEPARGSSWKIVLVVLGVAALSAVVSFWSGPKSDPPQEAEGPAPASVSIPPEFYDDASSSSGPTPRTSSNRDELVADLDRNLNGAGEGFVRSWSWKGDTFTIVIDADRYSPNKASAAALTARAMFDLNNQPLPQRLIIRDYKGRISEEGSFANIPSISP